MANSSFSKLISNEKPVLIDFHATWCGPCKSFMPILKDVKSELGDKIRMVKIDIDKNQALSQKLNVMGVPTVMIYQNGDLKWQATGAQPKQVLLNELKKYI